MQVLQTNFENKLRGLLLSIPLVFLFQDCSLQENKALNIAELIDGKCTSMFKKQLRMKSTILTILQDSNAKEEPNWREKV